MIRTVTKDKITTFVEVFLKLICQNLIDCIKRNIDKINQESKKFRYLTLKILA